MSTPRTLSGKRILITGAGRGIGRATATELTRRGAQVAIGDVDADAAKDAADRIGPAASAYHLDVTDAESFGRFITDAGRDLGGIDVLVNNAGIMPIGHFLDVALPTVQRATSINLLGPIIGMRSVLPLFLEQGHGHVVNVASSAGRTPVPGGTIYCAQKAGIISLTDSARLEFGSRGITFTAVMPSFTNTDLISGTKGTNFVKTVEPEEVATGIAKAIEQKKRDVYAPASLRAIYALEPFLGRRVREAMYRSLGAYDTFLDIDPAGRAAYDERINRS